LALLVPGCEVDAEECMMADLGVNHGPLYRNTRLLLVTVVKAIIRQCMQ
jgi:hypothetical protein